MSLRPQSAYERSAAEIPVEQTPAFVEAEAVELTDAVDWDAVPQELKDQIKGNEELMLTYGDPDEIDEPGELLYSEHGGRL